MDQHRILDGKLITISEYQHLFGITTIEPSVFYQQAIIELTGPFAQDRTLVQGSYASEWIESTLNSTYQVRNYIERYEDDDLELLEGLRVLGVKIASLSRSFIGEDITFNEERIRERIDSISLSELIRRYNDTRHQGEEIQESEDQRESESDSEDERSSSEESEIDEDQQDETPFYIGVNEDLSDRDGPTPSSVMISKISHAQYDMGLTEMSPNRFTQLTREALDLTDDTGEDYLYLAVIYEILGNLEYSLETIDREDLREQLHRFAREVSEMTELFEITEDDAPVGWNAVRANLEAIDIESLIRRHRE